MRLPSLLCSLVPLALSLAARADSFSLSGTLTDGGTFNGTLSISAQGNAFVQGTFSNGAYSFTLPQNYLGEQLGEGAYTTVDAFPAFGPNFSVFLVIPDGTLVGYGGGNLCALRSSCGLNFYSSYSDSQTAQTNFITLSATPAATPEPGSMVLLGTALLGITAVMKRRLA